MKVPQIVLHPTHLPCGLSDLLFTHPFIVYYSNKIITKCWIEYLSTGFIFLSSHQVKRKEIRDRISNKIKVNQEM